MPVFSTDKDWEDIKFGVDNQVDFYAVSFVKDARVVHELKDYLKSEFLVYVFVYFKMMANLFNNSHFTVCLELKFCKPLLQVVMRTFM